MLLPFKLFKQIYHLLITQPRLYLIFTEIEFPSGQYVQLTYHHFSTLYSSNGHLNVVAGIGKKLQLSSDHMNGSDVYYLFACRALSFFLNSTYTSLSWSICPTFFANQLHDPMGRPPFMKFSLCPSCTNYFSTKPCHIAFI